MTNRIKKDADRFIVNDGTDGGPWAKFTWCDGRLVVDSFCEMHMTPRTVRELAMWAMSTEPERVDGTTAASLRAQRRRRS